MKKYLVVIVAAMVVMFAAPGAQAVSFDLVGVNNPANTATVNFLYDDVSFIISIDITNTSTYDGDPRITGFTFNAPTNVTGVSAFTGPSGWTYLYDPNDINTPMNFGKFDVAGDTYPPQPIDKGIPEGATYSFTFTIAGTNLGSLNEYSFLNLFSAVGVENGTPQYFTARFQRTDADGEGSDVATPVPEPGTMLLLGTGMLGLGLLRRRQSVKRA